MIPVIALIKQGISFKKMALSIALGTTIGIFPVLGTTTLLGAIGAFALRLNLPAIQIFNYLVYPLQIGLIIPFYKLGDWLFGEGPESNFAWVANDVFQRDHWEKITMIIDSTIYAVGAWLIISPFLVTVLYTVLKPILARVHLPSGAIDSGRKGVFK